jgi:hypothetical protein
MPPNVTVETTLNFTSWLVETGAEGTANTAAGYHVCLAALDALLDGRPISITDSDDLVRELGTAYSGLA